jgi:hypothetical protein
VPVYLVRTENDDDDPDQTAGVIAKTLAVTFHDYVAARPEQGWELTGAKDESWLLYNRLGNHVGPREEHMKEISVGISMQRLDALVTENLAVLNKLEPHLGCAKCHGDLVDGVCPVCQPPELADV